MSSFYTTQMMAFQKIDERLKKGLENSGNCNVNQLILDITAEFPVSPKAVRKRIEMFVAAKQDKMKILVDEVILK